MEWSDEVSGASSAQNIQSYFATIEGIICSSVHNITHRCVAWRQQSLILKSLDYEISNILMERHWIHYYSLIDRRIDIERDLNFGLSDYDSYINFEFPNINLVEVDDDDELLQRKYFDNQNVSNSIEMLAIEGNKNINENQLVISRNTMDNFLHQKTMTTNNQQSSFCSARQLLAAQTSKKQSETKKQQCNWGNVEQKNDIGFNFAATKKSLGALVRLVNTTRKSFVSPVRSKSSSMEITEINCKESIDIEMTHPALKNIDSKMIELINNEIIYNFKPVDWNQIAGLEYAKSIIKEAVVYPLLRPDIFTGLRRPPRGILLFGPPGTGKTLIGKCIASQSCSTFFSISSASLTSKWMGEGEKMVRALFAVAVARQPSVIFIDEIDSLLSQRSENENEGTRRLKTEFLVRLDGTATSDDDRVLIVGATNRPQELDEAVRRRFVKRLYVPLPEINARAEILKNLLKTVEHNLNSNDVREISELAEGYSGADMDSLCREASMEPLRSLPAETIITFHKEHLRPVNIDDLHTALKKIRPSVSQNDLSQYVEWNKTYGSSY